MSSDTPGGRCGDSGITSLVRILTLRQVPDEVLVVREGCEPDQEYIYLRDAIMELRGAILATASGDLSFPIRHKGYVPGALKALQAALRHLTWQTSAIAAGDFSQRVEFLGEFSIAFNEMVRQLEESVEKLKRSKHDLWLAAHTDPLTGMDNRARFFELYEPLFKPREWLDSSRTSGLNGGGSGEPDFQGSKAGVSVHSGSRNLDSDMDPDQYAMMKNMSVWFSSTPPQLALVMLDIDHFKRVNDTYGHAAGDEALRSVAECFKELVFPAGTFWGRIGGEEFALVIPVQSSCEAYEFAESLRQAIERKTVVVAGLGFGITASQGLCMRREGDSPESLLSRVDAAMYRAKESGRNRVCQESDCV